MFNLEYGYVSLNKKGEELCGDKVECINKNKVTTLVLSDGLGSGVKANILATLTCKILCTMVAEGIALDECISTIISSLPVCKVRGVAYSTFSVLSIDELGNGFLAEFDNPPAVLIKDGKFCPMETSVKLYCDKKIRISKINLNVNDLLIVMSDGVLHAGIGQNLNFGWDIGEIREFCENNYLPSQSARTMASLVANACYQLYGGLPGDDTTILCCKYRKTSPVSIMIGPPAQKEQDSVIVADFLSLPGKKIVCGGTSSQVVARELRTEVTTSFDYQDKDVPPIGYINGIDLTTEGVLTLKKVVEYGKNYLSTSSPDIKLYKGKDGASKLLNLLFIESTAVNIFVGRNVNPAHEGLGIDNKTKLDLVETLISMLKELNKNVTIKYY